jgi:stage III sporulation protein AH
MVINRRHIILASLVVALGLAIFLNYRFSDGSVTTSAKTSSGNLGDTAYVANQNVSSAKTDFFATVRLQRSQNRDTSEQVEKSITGSSSATAAQREKACETINQIVKDINTEGNIETIIKAKGFAECVCVISNGGVEVVVKPKTSNSLSANDIAIIDDVVLSQTKSTKVKIIQQN